MGMEGPGQKKKSADLDRAIAIAKRMQTDPVLKEKMGKALRQTFGTTEITDLPKAPSNDSTFNRDSKKNGDS